MDNPSNHIALIIGDITLAWDFIHRTGEANPSRGYDPEDRFIVYQQSAGAWHMTKILKAMKERENWDWEIHGVGPRDRQEQVHSNFNHEQLSHAYAIWTDFPLSPDRSNDKATRVRSYLGTEMHQEEPPTDWFNPFPHEKIRVKLLVVTDDGVEDKYAVNRPNLLNSVDDGADGNHVPWILYKQRRLDHNHSLVAALSAGNVKNDNERYNALYQHAVAVVSVDVLRKEVHNIGHGLSWETLVQQTRNAVLNHEELKRFRYVVVSFTNVGALIILPSAGSHCNTLLVCDPAETENSWTARYEGNMVGSTTCLVAAIARGLIKHINQNTTDLDLVEPVKDGLLRMRALHYLGYFADKDKQAQLPHLLKRTHDEHNPTTNYVTIDSNDLETTLDFKKAGAPDRFAGYTVPLLDKDASWTIIEQELGLEQLHKLAQRMMATGPKKALEKFPKATYSKLIATDPSEIDAFQSITTLFRSYVDSPGDKPLSIALFGAPGSGKSFAVKQIAKGMGSKISGTPSTFNLSQFSEPDMLIGAFHQIRDVGLSGKIPLVFWDEFDTSHGNTERGWLRYFLAPMQDGEFQEGQVTHPIGRAIFVFAGGTYETFKLFRNGPNDSDKKAKVPDFVSRLRGYLDIRGVNQRDAKNEAYIEPPTHTKLRRALILYQKLKGIPSIVEGDDVRIDDAVLNAFLKIKEYRYGARSLEAIIDMSSFHETRRFTTSCLPSPQQLSLHVDGNQFLELCRSDWV